MKIAEKDTYRYAELKVQIWNTCYNHILPEEYLNTISISQKAAKYQREMQINPFSAYYFIIISDTPIGVLRLNYYQCLTKDNCVCIKDLYLLPHYQNKGYGGAIFNFIKKEATNNNCRFITAWIFEQNQIVRKLVSKLGFKLTSQIQIHKKTNTQLLEYCYNLYD